MELHEIQKLTSQAMRIFNKYSDDTNNGPEMKQITTLVRKVEEMMYKQNPNEGDVENRSSNVPPYRHMNKKEEKYFLESIHEVLIKELSCGVKLVNLVWHFILGFLSHHMVKTC
jgi:hypothetical protein